VGNLSDWLFGHYGQEHFHPGLERIKMALGPMLGELNQKKIVTIAGTNGKGETTLRLSQFLGQTPHCVWISPHIQRITERLRSEQGEISLSSMEQITLRCHERIQKQNIGLTYYEFLFFVFCTWAIQEKAEILLLEVGLGGRLDAVNALDAQLVLIPSISRDHQEFLGRRYDQILREKLGVVRADSTLVSFFDLQYLKERTQAFTQGIGANYLDLSEDFKLPSYAYSQRNQLLAFAGYKHLTTSKLDLGEWSPQAPEMENRGEVITRGAAWILSGSHNVDGLRKLIQFLGAGTYNFPNQSFDVAIVAFSKRDPKDIKLMLRMIKLLGARKVIVTCFEHPKAASQEMIKGPACEEGLEFVEKIDSFVNQQTSGKILVTGSYYFLGYIKSLLCR
jgi:dihydrofolate synthase/folylpolyglutamate synthase